MRTQPRNTMKTTVLIASLLAGLAAVPASAHAGRNNEKVWIGVGSFLGGVLIGSQIERHTSPPPVVYCPPPVYEPAPVVIVERPRHYAPPEPCGYWKTIQTRVYVPERWIITTDRCGRRTRILQPGYYTYETQRVWVDTTPSFREERHYSGYGSGERTDTFVVSDGGRPRYRF